MTSSGAREKLKESGLNMKVRKVNSDAPAGQVVRQSREAGEIVDHGIRIIVDISVGSATIEDNED